MDYKNKRVGDDQAFHFSGYGTLFSLEEMRDHLDKAASYDFAFHVNHYKNDIASWIEGVFGDKHLADKIRSTVHRRQIIAYLSQALGEQVVMPKETQVSHAQQHEHKHTTHKHHEKSSLEEIHEHIARLEKDLGHLADRKNLVTLRDNISLLLGKNLKHEDFRQGLMEFGLGFAVGLAAGLILGKTMGLY